MLQQDHHSRCTLRTENSAFPVRCASDTDTVAFLCTTVMRTTTAVRSMTPCLGTSTRPLTRTSTGLRIKAETNEPHSAEYCPASGFLESDTPTQTTTTMLTTGLPRSI